jgi:bifunctional non-homologous end joining protein LigD
MRSAGLSFIPPLLPTLIDEPPEGDDWIHEIKQDGYRTQIILDRGGARILTRRGHDWTTKYGLVAAAAEQLPAKTAILDGEMVAVDKQGRINIRDFRAALEGNPGRLLSLPSTCCT